MHKFLFGNRRTSISSYNPFGSSKNMKPGIITKIKNKIQGLFQTTINSQSIIQRIQSFDDQNLEQELSNQFKNNLVLIDRILPNKEDGTVLKRKSIFPFEQYLKEEGDSAKKYSQETQTDISNKPSDLQCKTTNAKKQQKFKKVDSKIYKSRKMEENPKQLEFNLNKQNFKQNKHQKLENSSEYYSNYSNKRLKQFDSFTESSIPLKQQKAETSDYLSPVKILENQLVIQNNENKNLKCDSFLKALKGSSSAALSPSNNDRLKDDLNNNNQFSSSTGTNSKEEGNETIQSFKSGFFQQAVQENVDDLDKNKKASNSQQNQDLEPKNIQNVNQKQSDFSLNQKKDNQLQEVLNIEQNKLQNSSQENSTPKDKQEGQGLFPQQDQFLNQNLISQNEKQEHMSDNISKIQDLQSQQSQDIQKNILQVSFLNNQNKQTVEKNDKSIKESNPFLVQSSNISSDQINLYFQACSQSNQNKQCQPQNQNQPIMDLFKISAQQPQQIVNKPQDKQNTQNLLQSVHNFENAKILQYSTNKQMEIIEQASPQLNQVIQNKQKDFEAVQLSYQQQLTQQNTLFQQQQQQQQQHYSQQLIQQQSFQLQNHFTQQRQTQNQISSLNVFQSNPFQQQQQNDLSNKSMFLKNDVLSLFQDTKKSDKDIFQAPLLQQTSSSLNNSFNKAKKKQRINNC
ncbi:unnamed protein product [Paramecium octaurelia]|uniref:Uncharacterized protein n=1 Tax=Paramecium octaurelia TaxID=43137 RepID=A0A8S1TAY0_PAROT|nr:unnamed protein product [Paramecium octaurelia]